MRITIEIDCKDTATATVHTPTATTTYPQLSDGLPSTADSPAPLEVLRMAAALGASSAGPAPAEVHAAAVPQVSALSTPAARPGVTDAGAAPGL